MNKMIGNKDFNILGIEAAAGYMLKIKAIPFTIYFERNADEDDNRIQFGIGIFNYRFGIVLDKSMIN